MIERDTNIESNESSERKNNDTTYDSKSGSSDHKNIEIKHKGNENIESDKYKNKIIDEKDINEQFSEALDFMNNDFIYIEPLLIPFIPGDDPLLINKVSESSEDCF